MTEFLIYIACAAAGYLAHKLFPLNKPGPEIPFAPQMTPEQFLQLLLGKMQKQVQETIQVSFEKAMNEHFETSEKAKKDG